MSDDRERRLRREPRTEESESIVAAIVQAAGELLVAHGVDGITTNRVAKRAGVSVGSVYRYFPDKETIVTEIGRRHRRRNAERVSKLVGSDGDIDSVIRSVLQSFVALEGHDAELRRVLSSEVPPAWLREAADEAWSIVQQGIAAALRLRLPALSEEQASLRAFVALHAVEGVARDATLRLPAGDREAILTELSDMLALYLRRD